MALLICSDCGNYVSSSARSCVHCGNILIAEVPGAIGVAIRVVYVVLCAIIIAAAMVATPASGMLAAVAGVAALFVLSVSFVILLYVTRRDRRRAVRGATRPVPVEAGG